MLVLLVLLVLLVPLVRQVQLALLALIHTYPWITRQYLLVPTSTAHLLCPPGVPPGPGPLRHTSTHLMIFNVCFLMSF